MIAQKRSQLVLGFGHRQALIVEDPPTTWARGRGVGGMLPVRCADSPKVESRARSPSGRAGPLARRPGRHRSRDLLREVRPSAQDPPSTGVPRRIPLVQHPTYVRHVRRNCLSPSGKPSEPAMAMASSHSTSGMDPRLTLVAKCFYCRPATGTRLRQGTPRAPDGHLRRRHGQQPREDRQTEGRHCTGSGRL